MSFIQIENVFHQVNEDPNESQGYNGLFVFDQLATICGIRMPVKENEMPEQVEEMDGELCEVCKEHAPKEE